MNSIFKIIKKNKNSLNEDDLDTKNVENSSLQGMIKNLQDMKGITITVETGKITTMQNVLQNDSFIIKVLGPNFVIKSVTKRHLLILPIKWIKEIYKVSDIHYVVYGKNDEFVIEIYNKN